MGRGKQRTDDIGPEEEDILMSSCVRLIRPKVVRIIAVHLDLVVVLADRCVHVARFRVRLFKLGG